MITLTESAAKRIKASQEADNNPNLMLRLAITGGGCSGFNYHFSFTDDRRADDLVFEQHGVTLLVDDVSLGLIDGSEIDFVNGLMGAAFKVRNPNATANCGCGTSFSI